MKNDRVADVVSYPAKKNNTLLEMISFDVKPAQKVYICKRSIWLIHSLFLFKLRIFY